MQSFILAINSEVSLGNSTSMTDKVSFYISLIGFLISLIVFIKSIWADRFTVKVFQDYNGDQSGFIESFDGCFAPVSADEADGRPKVGNIALARITISNNSSLPVSIVKFSIKGNYAVDFASHSHTEDFYSITQSENVFTHFGYVDKPLEYIKPIFKLDPYETKQGYISFVVFDVDTFKSKNKHKLAVQTSRGTKNFQIKFSNHYKSMLERVYTLPKQFKYDSRPK